MKELARELSVPLSKLFNFSLIHGKVPDKWKEAHVCAVFKKGDPSLVSNYRPISLLNTIDKVLERLVFKQIFSFLRNNNFLTQLQSGFIPGYSTVNQLTYLYNTFCQALDSGKEVRVVFFDISKAFDRVWHKGLMEKMKAAGISGSVLEWFSDYLHNRRQRVVLPGAESGWNTIRAGVPQGSILGPLLFLVFINDIVTDIGSSIRLFADDTSLSIIVEQPDSAAALLNSDILKITDWAERWLVNFNPTKTESLIISRKFNNPPHPPLSMYDQHISEVESHKHLGLFLSDNCTWHKHLDYVKTKAWGRINIMRKLKFVLDRKSLEIIYLSFIRPLLEYADVIWDNCTAYEKLELDRIQNEAARIATGTTKLISLALLQQETGWETLEYRRYTHRLILFYKMKNNLTPPYLSSLIPSSVSSQSHYGLRNSDDLRTVATRTSLYYNSFLPSTTREWNSLPQQARELDSLGAFKHSLKANSTGHRPPLYFYFGNRKAQLLHARLRTHCSSLNDDLFQKNISDSPLCSCGSIENAEHYFFTCPRYSDLQLTLMFTLSQLCTPSLGIILYGDTALSYETNTRIFQAVHTYITESKRF